jgi:UDP-N-acetylmuramate--alanine ligase
MDTFKNSKHIHFIGIGGIGMSALARLFLSEGKKVTGSDATDSEIITELKKLGATISIGQTAEHIDNTVDVVVYTVAISDDNPEFVEAQGRKLPIYTYAEAMGKVSEGKYTVAISGTHGKTTTTAMVAQVAIDAGLSPSVIVGSLLKEPRTNFIAGESNLFVVEACEYKRSFLSIQPNILVITNIDEDHLDYYKDISDIQSAFISIAQKIPADGYLVCNTTDPHLQPVIDSVQCKVIDYTEMEELQTLKVPGRHNRENAKAVLAVADILSVSKAQAIKSLSEFSGTWRRFEYRGETKSGVIVYDDYAHHPAEIKATLAGAREYFGDKKITVVFQPHLYSRTRDHLDNFSQSFVDVDKVIFVPIYAAREPFDPRISSEMIAQKIGDKAMSFESMTAATDYLKSALKAGEVVITMGAGDVFKVADALLKGDF